MTTVTSFDLEITFCIISYARENARTRSVLFFSRKNFLERSQKLLGYNFNHLHK